MKKLGFLIGILSSIVMVGPTETLLATITYSVNGQCVEKVCDDDEDDECCNCRVEAFLPYNEIANEEVETAEEIDADYPGRNDDAFYDDFVR